MKSQKASGGGSGDVDVNNRVTHFKIFQDCRAAIKLQAFASLIFSYLGLAFELPARRVRWDGERAGSGRSLGVSGSLIWCSVQWCGKGKTEFCRHTECSGGS